MLKQRGLVLVTVLILIINISFVGEGASGQSEGHYGQTDLKQDGQYWAVIAACCWILGDTASNDAQYMYHVLRHHYMFDGIYYLDVRTDFPGVDANATKKNFRWAINNWTYTRSDGDDAIFIFVVGHGGGYNIKTGEIEYGREDDDGDEGLEHFINGTWMGVDECILFDEKEKYWDDELKTDLNALNYSKLIFVRVGDAEERGCFNGGLIDDISGPNRTIMTASNETYYCWPDKDGDGFSEWSEAFMDALHGEDTFWDNSASTLVHTGGKCNADLDKDGNVSMWEAWNYSWWHDDYRIIGWETPWLDANGNGLPTYKNGTDISAPYEEPEDRLMAETVWFPKRILGDLNGDHIVDIYDAIRLACSYGKSWGQTGYDIDADLNFDRTVDIYDAIALATHFGEGSCDAGGDTQSSGTQSTDPHISVCPNEITIYRDETFSVNITVTNITDLYGYEFKLYYNASILNCTGVELPSGHFLEPVLDPENLWIIKKEANNDYNSTHGRVWVAVSLMADEPGKNGSGILAAVNFTAVAAGSSILDLHDAKLGNSQAEAISAILVDGSVTVLGIYYMRSDMHTVNGLTAYKLGETQTTILTYFQSDAGGLKALSWGIRVWKRGSDGQETEVTGGSPIAIVTRTSNGEGIQSAAWNSPETSLEQTDAIVVRVYQRFGQGGWLVAAEFTTKQLDANKLDSATWTVYYYTSRSYLPGYPPYLPPTTTGCFYWGTATHNSHIEIELN